MINSSRHSRMCCGVLLALCGLAQSVHAAVIAVPADQPSIQAAVAAASIGDEIVLAPGTYTESVDLLGKGIKIRGSGGAAVTIISPPTGQRGVVISNAADPVVLEGVTVTGAAISGASGAGVFILNSPSVTFNSVVVSSNTVTNGSGGGISIDGGQLALVQSSLTGNTVNGGAAGTDIGGGLSIGATATVISTNSTFTGNSAVEAGGGAIGVAIGGEITVTGGVFSNNSAQYTGACVTAEEPGVASFNSVTFIDNTADGGSGGAIYHYGTSLSINNCTFTNQVANGGTGGAIEVLAGELIVTSSTFTACSVDGASGGAIVANLSSGQITNSSFVNCSAAGGEGGALTLGDSTITVSGSLFSGCSAEGGQGGAITLNGGSIDNASIVNCRFISNSAESGGGAAIAIADSARPVLMNCVFIGNGLGEGAVAFRQSSNGRLINSTIVHNGVGPAIRFEGAARATVANSIIRCDAPGGAIVATGSGLRSVTFSNIQGGYVGTGNIDAVPLFVSLGTGDLRLSAGSPGIDAGSNLLVPAGQMTDAAGSGRYVDDPSIADTGVAGGEGGSLVVDMGAFEFAPSAAPQGCNPADIACDDGTPLAALPGCVNSATGPNEGDYNAFFAADGFFFQAGQGSAAIGGTCDIACDDGTALTDSPGCTNNGVNEGDFNCFFNNLFLPCV
jgi:predicted outer membrane repeat protein